MAVSRIKHSLCWLWVALLVLAGACAGGEKPAEDATPTGEAISLPDTLTIEEVVGLAKVEPKGRLLSINPEVGGLVKAVHFTENQHIDKGDVLIELDQEVESAQLMQARSAVNTQGAALEAAKANIASLEVKLAEARRNLQRNQNLYAGQAATQQTLEDSQFAVEDLEKQIASAQATVREQEARLREQETALRYQQALLKRRTITAPLAGTFLSVEVRTGSYLNTSASLGDFAPDGPLIAIAEIDELFALRVREGQDAYIRLQGETTAVGRGKIIFAGRYLKKKSLFSDAADNLEDRRVREVHVELEPDAEVLIGSRVECVIDVNR